jgi:hypothetical protein
VRRTLHDDEASASREHHGRCERDHRAVVGADREVRDTGRKVRGADRAELNEFAPSSMVGPVCSKRKRKKPEVSSRSKAGGKPGHQ